MSVDRVLERIPRHSGWILAAVLVLTAIALTGIVDPRTGAYRVRVDASADRLLPEHDESRRFYDEVRRRFGTDETLLVGLVGDDVFTRDSLERIARLTGRLEQLDGVHHVLSVTNAVNVRGVDQDLAIEPFVSEIPADPAALAELRREVLGNPLAAGNLVSRDGRAAALLVYFRDMSHQEYFDSGLDSRVVRTAEEERGDAKVWITGGPHIRVESAKILLRDSVTLPALALVVLATVLAWSFRTVLGVVLPLLSIGIALCWTLALATWLGFTLNAVTGLVPALLVTVGLSYSVHVISEYYDEVRDGREDVRWRRVHAAMLRVALPVAISALTTAVGFASLALSPLGAVREFGVLSVIGVACAMVASLTFTPAALVAAGGRREPGRAAGGGHERFDRFAERLGRLAVLRPGALFLAHGLLFVVSVIGATQLRVGTQQISKFRPDAPVRLHFEAVNRHLEGANPLYVVVETDVPDGFKEPVNLRGIEALQSWLAAQPEIGATTSLVDYVKLINRGFHGNDSAQFAVPESRRLVSQLLLFGASEELERFVDSRYQTASVRVRARVVDSDDVAALTARIESRLAELPRHLRASVTGTAVVFNRALDEVIRGQTRSVLAAFGVIYLILAALFVSLRIGALALIPNVLPVAVYFGALGFTGVRLSPGTSLIAPIVIGIAVDNTIHYVARFMREARRFGDEQRATVSALKATGRPITWTTLALCAGFLVLNASEFGTQGELGNLAAFALGFAWLADLTLAPALCARLRIVTLWDLLLLDLGPDPKHSIPVFAGLSAAQARIAGLMATMLRVRAGERLFGVGEPGRALYLVIDGRLESRTVRRDGGSEVSTRKRGDVVGEIGLFHEQRIADVDVLEDARLLVLTRSSLDRLARVYPRIATVVFRNLSRLITGRIAATAAVEPGSGHGAARAREAGVLGERAGALADAFFAREAHAPGEVAGASSAGLVVSDRQDRSAEDLDPALLGRLGALGVPDRAVSALLLVPLVEVAWADGRLQDKERRAILAGAEATGLTPGGPAFELLRRWLERRPEAELLARWRECVAALAAELSVEGRLRLQESVVGRARRVAESAGGVLGLGAVSRAEERMLIELERAFHP